MFEEPCFTQQPFPPSVTTRAGLFIRAETSPHAPINIIRNIPRWQTPPASSSLTQQPSFTYASSLPPGTIASPAELVGHSSLELGNTARDHPLYHNVTPHADGLYHCPWENKPEANCKHKPEKFKNNYEYD
jgi:hypothetical protein